jgi:hypothetical protein
MSTSRIDMTTEKPERSGQGRKTPRQPANATFRYSHWDLGRLVPHPLGPGPWNPTKLFAECSAQEETLRGINMRNVFASMHRFYLFGYPLFGEASNSANEGYPLQFTIGRPKSIRKAKVDWRYAELLRYLKELKDTELRWLLIARWLSEEDICSPEEFLPRGVLRRMLEKARARTMPLSPRDLYHWNLVKIWYPYFEALFIEIGRVPKSHRGPGETLVKLGYLEDAVRWSLGKRSVVQAAAIWLEQRNTTINSRKRLSARSLENAYSRVNVAMRNADSDFEKLQNQQSKAMPR